MVIVNLLGEHTCHYGIAMRCTSHRRFIQPRRVPMAAWRGARSRAQCVDHLFWWRQCSFENRECLLMALWGTSLVAGLERDADTGAEPL